MDPTATASTTPSLTAHLSSSSPSAPEEDYTPPEGIHLGRENVKWGPEVWKRMDRAVRQETKATCIARKFLPHYHVGAQVTTVPAQTVLANLVNNTPYTPPVAGAGPPANPPLLNIDEGAFIRIIELWTEFSLTSSQVHDEMAPDKTQPGHPEPAGEHQAQSGHHAHHRTSTAVTLARRAAQVLALGVDTMIFTGLNALTSPLFVSETILNRGVPLDSGLMCTGGTNPSPLEVIQVPQISPPNNGVPPVLAKYSENTVAATNSAYSKLSASGYPAPYAGVLHFYPYADSFAPLPTTLILPADRMGPLMEAGYFSSSVLPGVASPQFYLPAGSPPGSPPAEPQATGFFISLAGHPVQLVIGLEPITGFSQVDPNGNMIFRVLTRFALRGSDFNSIVTFNFE